MAKVKVIVDYSNNRYSDSELNVKAGSISTNLATIPAFQTLVPISVIIKTLNDEFGVWLAKMPDGNKQTTLAKNQSRLALEKILGTSALKVEDICAGDEILILSAGFDVKRKATSIGVLDMPGNVTAKAGATRGSLEINWNVVSNAYIYELQYTEAPSTENSKWIRTSNTKHKVVIENLVRGQAYCIQVAAAASDPRRVWSDEIISYVM